jgi:acetyl-CoA synthetase
LDSNSHDSGNEIFPVLEAQVAKAHINSSQYESLYQESIRNPDTFWAEIAERLDWIKPFSKVKNTSFELPISIKWFEDGKLNVAVNCIDRHLPERADQVAIIWEADNPEAASRKITYLELSEHVGRWANTLKSLQVKKGDRVTIYMPMIPEAAFAMLACARIGAIHSVIFGGFSPDSISDRIQNCRSDFVITSDHGFRGGKTIDIKKNIDLALLKCPEVRHVLVYKHSGKDIPMLAPRDLWFSEASQGQSPNCKPETMDAEDPLFLLYTSGSTGKPKGVLHTTAGYLLFAAYTHETVFDYRNREVYWCTADIGWVTGHSYTVYGPLANGATTLMFEGIPTYPDVSRFWQIIDKYQVNVFYTAPTAIRSLMREGVSPTQTTTRKSLRLLGTVGEPINPEAWLWYHRVIGHAQLPIVDTWWQTETGGIMISPLPYAIAQKPGSATKPFFGVTPVLVDEKGQILDGPASGNLCIADSWPGQMRTVYGDHDRFEQTYFSTYKGMYFTGDGCRRDEDGYYWITGRVDDVLNVSGHRLGTAEIESALVSNHAVAEAAVVGYPHDIKGQGIYAFVTLKTGIAPSEELKSELIKWVRNEISPIAQPDILQWAPGLPKTRSGKIMRRILRKIAENNPEQLGDTSTLADPSVVQSLVDQRLNRSRGE